MATIQAIDKMSKSSGLSKAPKIKAFKTDSSPSHKESSTREGSGKKKNKNKKDQFNPSHHQSQHQSQTHFYPQPQMQQAYQPPFAI